MPNTLQKSLNGYMSKIQLLSSNSFSSSKKWVLAGSKQAKKITFSFKQKQRSSKTRLNDDHQDDPNKVDTLSDVDRFLEENRKSLCIGEEEEEEDDDHMTRKKEKRDQSSDDDDTDDDDDYRHRFERTWGSPAKLSDRSRRTERLSPPPGSSEGRCSMYTTSEEERPSSRRSNLSSLVLPENCVTVLRYTEEPQEEFRRSMVEMVESKLGRTRESEVDWDLMEEILFCYLDLNDKKTHKFILSAFVDLIVSLSDKEKRITRKSIERSLSTRAARERLGRRMSTSDAFRN